MTDFYDRLEAQLADATARGVRRHGWPLRVPTPRWRGDWLAAAAAVAVTLIVVAVFIGLGDRRAAQRHVRPAGPAVVVNYGSGRLPALGGVMVCNADLSPPRPGSPRGVVVVNTRPPTRYAFSLTASGLARTAGSGVYAVWLVPATQLPFGGYQLLRSQAELFVGVIRPTVGPSGRLAVEGLLPQSASGDYLVRVTLQPHPSSRTPGRTILQGFIGL
jgi:hypothetical protein